MTSSRLTDRKLENDAPGCTGRRAGFGATAAVARTVATRCTKFDTAVVGSDSEVDRRTTQQPVDHSPRLFQRLAIGLSHIRLAASTEQVRRRRQLRPLTTTKHDYRSLSKLSREGALFDVLHAQSPRRCGRIGRQICACRSSVNGTVSVCR
jgi:hypothetical protein